MEHHILVAAIVVVSFIAFAQPTMLKGYGYGHGYKQYKGHGHSQMGQGRSQKGPGHIQKGSGSGYQLCYPIAERGDPCDTNKQCAWNFRECPDYAGCHLICTDNPYKWCYGLDQGQDCTDNMMHECHPDITGELVCVDTCEICGCDEYPYK